MSRFRSLYVCLFSVAALGLCAAAPAFAQAKLQDADQKAIASYRLTMENVNRMASVNRALVNELKNDPRYKQMMDLQAQIKPLEDKEDSLSEADQAKLEDLRAKADQLEEQNGADDVFGDAKSIDDMAAKAEQFPPLAKALRTAGVSGREYATFMMAMIQASFAAGMQKAGMLKQLPAGVSAENVKFVLEHEAELKKMQEELQALGK